MSCGSGSGAGGGDTKGNTASITLSVSVASIPVDGNSTTITATLKDNTGTAVDRGTSVAFSTTLGTFPPSGTGSYSTSTPDTSGQIQVSLESGTTAGTATVTVTSNNVSQKINVEFTTQTAGTITVTAGSDSLVADGTSSTVITAWVEDTTGAAMDDGTVVTFTTTAGNLSASTGSTTNGEASVTLTSATTPGTATITATVGQASGVASVEFTSVRSSLSLGLSQTTVQSDNSDSTTVTATVLDSFNAVIPGVSVAFSANGGQLSAAGATTDSNGHAEVTFSSGTTEQSNRVVTITATVTDLDPAQIPVQVTGTTLSLSTDTTNLEIGGDEEAILTVTAKDAGMSPIYNARVTITSPPNVVQIDPSEGYTDINGQVVATVTGINATEDPVTITVEGLGATATQDYTVGALGEVFRITAPADSPHSANTSDTVTVTVSAPDPGTTDVQFATTLGVWDGGTDKVVTVPVAAGEAEADLTSSEAGTANILVLDPDDTTVSDSLIVLFSAPSSEAAKISLQASSSVVAPSVGGLSNAVTLQATVKNVTDQVVGGAAVAFSIEDPTGGGEYVSPPIVYTNDFGVAETSFTSGSLGTDAQGVTVTAAVVSNPAVSDSIQIIIGGTAGAVIIGQSTTISSINNDTAYSLPMSVMVSDANGSPVSGAIVTLNLWPTRYRTGCWVKIDDDWVIADCGADCDHYVVYTEFFPNEDDFYQIGDDRYRNLILDEGEDLGPGPTPSADHADGELTPPLSAAGSVPATVTTDENGIGTFNLTYLKTSTPWLEVEITASTVVSGTENIGTYKMVLPWMKGEESSLANSPFNYQIEIPNRVPTDISLDSTSVDEGEAVGTEVGVFSTEDQDGLCDRYTYSLVSGTGDTDNALFAIDNYDCALLTAEVFDRETQDTYFIRVRVDDGEGGTYEEAFTITVADINDETPTDITLDSTSVPELQPIGTVVGTFTTTDADTVGTHTYSLVAGIGDTDNASFTIVGDELQTAVVFTIPPNTYSIRVETDDGVNAPYQEPFVITVIP